MQTSTDYPIIETPAPAPKTKKRFLPADLKWTLKLLLPGQAIDVPSDIAALASQFIRNRGFRAAQKSDGSGTTRIWRIS